MSDQEPIRLLILEESQNRAEELIVLLRTAGRATRAHQIESEGDFVSKVSEQTWDLILASPESGGFTAEALLSQVQTWTRTFPSFCWQTIETPAVLRRG